MPRAFKPTDTYLVLLSAAAQRDDLLLDLASRLEGADLQRTGEKLLAAGLVAETLVGPARSILCVSPNPARARAHPACRDQRGEVSR